MFTDDFSCVDDALFYCDDELVTSGYKTKTSKRPARDLLRPKGGPLEGSYRSRIPLS